MPSFCVNNSSKSRVCPCVIRAWKCASRTGLAWCLAVLGVSHLLAGAAAGEPVRPAGPVQLSPELVSQGLVHPWALAFLPDGRYLVTERPGRMRIVESDGRLGAPLQGLPAVASGGQGGLLDVMLDSDFARNRQLYFCFSEADPEPGAKTNSTALAAARLSADGARLEDVRIVFSQRPKVASSAHFGCRIVEGQAKGKPDGSLLLGLGDRYTERDSAQALDTHLGKVVRVNKDGSVPADNPLVGRAGALPEVYSWGHRNIQGAARDGQGRLWMVEHGPQGGDELNRIEPAVNFGWPVITYGEHYGGGKIGRGTHRSGMAQPVLQWTPSFAPSGLAWLGSRRYGKDWQGSLFVGALKGQALLRLEMRGERVRAQQWLLKDLGQRIRDVRQGPDGWLYVLTDAPDGQLLRLKPRP